MKDFGRLQYSSEQILDSNSMTSWTVTILLQSEKNSGKTRLWFVRCTIEPLGIGKNIGILLRMAHISKGNILSREIRIWGMNLLVSISLTFILAEILFLRLSLYADRPEVCSALLTTRVTSIDNHTRSAIQSVFKYPLQQ